MSFTLLMCEKIHFLDLFPELHQLIAAACTARAEFMLSRTCRALQTLLSPGFFARRGIEGPSECLPMWFKTRETGLCVLCPPTRALQAASRRRHPLSRVSAHVALRGAPALEVLSLH